ncbi:MAG: GNAT family N-acetyltransferase [Gaiellaceae bacterium]
MNRDERVTLAAFRCLYPDVVEIGGATVLRSPSVPTSPMLNRIVGLGVDIPATEEALDAALAAMGDEASCYVAVSPDARPRELVEWLQARGLEPGWGWMSFRRGVGDVAPAETSLRLVEVGPPEAEAFGRVVATGYGLPTTAVPWVAEAPERGWACWLALDGDEPAAAAAIYVSEGAGYLGFAATLEEHRGKGAQNALLETRIRHAREQGCDVVLTETGERREEMPSNSYRNILRAGFEEIAVTANWLRPGRP